MNADSNSTRNALTIAADRQTAMQYATWTIGALVGMLQREAIDRDGDFDLILRSTLARIDELNGIVMDLVTNEEVSDEVWFKVYGERRPGTEVRHGH